MMDVLVDCVFIGFCMNVWIEDLWVVVVVVKGYCVFVGVYVMVVFGSGFVCK